ncbi:MAG: sensory rhodopsin transducer [Oscillospiraceae bacterium]
MEYGKEKYGSLRMAIYPRAAMQPYGHEALLVTNCGDSDADIRASVLFPDREPDTFTLHVPARRVNCFRLDCPVGDSAYRVPFGQYALLLESSVPVVAVLGRLDHRKDIAYYELDGFAM